MPKREVCEGCRDFRPVTISEIAKKIFWHCPVCGIQSEGDHVSRWCIMRLEQFVAIGKPMRLNKGRTFVVDHGDQGD
jgi:hypothetical protein